MMKIVDSQDINSVVHNIKAAAKTVVFTNGCFDILHAGHVRYLAAAKALGDILIVGLNSDCSVQSLKGPGRPVNCQADRAEVLAALAAVDFIIIFDDLTAEALVAQVQPDIYVKGGDYQVESLPEAKTVAAYGGKIVLVPEVPGRSSTRVIDIIRDAGKKPQ